MLNYTTQPANMY